MNKDIKLDKNGLYEYQQNRYPYLLLDRAVKIIPGKSAEGYKNFTINDWWFDVHFPDNPMVPGALMMESIVQLGALMVTTLPGNKGKVVYLTSANKFKLFRKVVPGDHFEIKTELLTWKRGIGKCKGEAFVDNKIVCSIDFNIVMPHILEEFSITKKNKD